MSAAIQLQNIERRFRQGGRTLEVLTGASLTLQAGEVVGLLGQSGSGKSTLLQIAGLLEKPDAGEVVIEGAAAGRLSDNERTRLRRRRLGFVYQFHYLLPEFSAEENVMLPLRIAQADKDEARQKAGGLLDRLGLADRLSHRPMQLSGGEQQRVAIARALANGPSILLADEPTGNLDEATAERVLNVFLELAQEQRVAAIVATHNTDLAKRMDRVVLLKDGQLHAE
ncbi:MAG: ABC transporter ATP-binding protein [Sphingomonadales bacterium]|nr:ABC transporter ATP-binding protein [Sphingomonadales bacterium]